MASIGCRDSPDVAMATDVIHLNARKALSSSLNCLICEQSIQRFATHDPERCIAGQLGNHRILQAPTEIHAADHLFHRGLQ